MDFKHIMTFLEQLKANNNKDWFDAHRKDYQQAKDDFEVFVQKCIKELAEIDTHLVGLEAKKAIFRIFRDVRFSKDKTPYKPNFGASLSPGGRKSSYAGYYLHLEPGASFIAGGIYHPEPEALAAVRQEIDYQPEWFKTYLNSTGFKRYFGELWQEDKLKTAPKGYPKDHPEIELLKYKSYLVSHEVDDNIILSGNLMEKITEVVSEVKPMVDFINNALEIDA